MCSHCRIRFAPQGFGKFVGRHEDAWLVVASWAIPRGPYYGAHDEHRRRPPQQVESLARAPRTGRRASTEDVIPIRLPT